MNALNLENDVERADALRQSALSFVETLEARANETEKLRQLSVETVANLKSIGFSRLCQPRKFGGAELPRNLAVDVLSILAGGCASTARVCAVYTDHSILLSMFQDKTTDEFWGENPEAKISSGYHPMGRVDRVDQGWNLSGKWGWMNGCDFADWFVFGAFLPNEGAGMVHNIFLVPRNDIEIEDNWHVMGMNGTGVNT